MRFSRGRAGFTLAATIATVVLAGPGAATAGTVGSIDVTATEQFGGGPPVFGFTGVPASVEKGKYKLTLNNEGNVAPHMIVFLRLTAAGSALSDAELLDAADAEEHGVVRGGGGGVFADPGTTSESTDKFPAGNYAYFCFVGPPERTPHYRLGMFGRMTVTK
jgi:hypothetical protein